MSSFITFLTKCNMLPLNKNVSYSLYSIEKYVRKRFPPDFKNFINTVSIYLKYLYNIL